LTKTIPLEAHANSTLPAISPLAGRESSIKEAIHKVTKPKMSKQQATLSKILSESRNYGITLTRGTKKRIQSNVLILATRNKKKLQKRTMSPFKKEGKTTQRAHVRLTTSSFNIPSDLFDSLFKNTFNLVSITEEGEIIHHFS
jgi:hypothetical protein